MQGRFLQNSADLPHLAHSRAMHTGLAYPGGMLLAGLGEWERLKLTLAAVKHSLMLVPSSADACT